MDEKAQLQLQAYLDGELAESERRQVEAWLARDVEAVAVVTELRQTTAALTGFEDGIKLPESREFYWSKIEREIQREARPEPGRTGGSLFAVWRRFLVTAGATVVVLVAGLLAVLQGAGARSPESELALADSEAFTYRDYSGGTTLVWVSFPAEREVSGAEFDDFLD